MDAAGSFSIEDLTLATYLLQAWHPILGTQKQALTVIPNETTSLELSFDPNSAKLKTQNLEA
jgi:hypothetical protein